MSWIKEIVGKARTVFTLFRDQTGDSMFRAASIIFSFPVIVVALLAANFAGGLSLVETLLGIFAIISFAVIATGWTIDHDI